MINKKKLLLEKSRSGGWQAKIGPGVLGNVLSKFHPIPNSNVLIDFRSSDDASVYDLNGTLLVQTLDFFTPLIEDPYLFGQIATVNALSDVYAMGAVPITAQSIVAFVKKMDHEILDLMLQGANDKLAEANVPLTGGHSIYDETVKFGLSVTGTAKNIWANNTANSGDDVYLTKKLGTGMMVLKEAELTKQEFEEVIQSMTMLNKAHFEIMKKYKISACTDVTGFGLLGHLHEMQNGKGFCIENNAIPKFAKIEEFKEVSTGSITQNKAYLEHKVLGKVENVLFDAQTSGGLLFTIASAEAVKLVAEMEANGLEIYKIGSVTKTNIIEVK